MSEDKNNKDNPTIEEETSMDALLKYANETIEPEDSKFSELSEIDINETVNKIYKKYNNRLNRFLITRLGSSENVDEITQELYLRLIRYPKLNELKPSFTFLCTIATNILKDQYRSKNLRKADAHISLDKVQLSTPPASPEQILSSKECGDGIIRLLESLKPNCRKAFLLHRFKGLTYNEIGKIMGISSNMVKKHITNTLSQLRKTASEYL